MMKNLHKFDLEAAFKAAVKLNELDAEIFPGMTIGSLFGN